MRVLIIGYVWPERQSSAAGLRDENLVDTFLSAGWQVTFSSCSQPNAFTEGLKTKGADVIPIQMNHPSFDTLIQNLRPDFVVFDRFVTEEQFGWRVRENCPTAIRILDTQDLHFLRKTREAGFKQNGQIIQAPEFLNRETFREIGSIYRCHGTLVLSSYEHQLLLRHFHIDPTRLLLSRFQYSPRDKILAGFEERSDFCFIGNFRHSPNQDGVVWLAREIWPMIRARIPDARLRIYGAYPSHFITSLHSPDEGFWVQGPVPNSVNSLAKHRVNLAPLRFGAGIKGKITDGWWSGTPVVTTSIGAEGMADDLHWGGAIQNNPLEFAEAATQLYREPSSWKIAQERGFKIIDSLYTVEANSAQLIQFLLNKRQEQASPSKERFFDALVNYHSHQGTKYFSKWIEEKSNHSGH